MGASGPGGMVLLLSAIWPERALIRAQLAADCERQVVGVDSPEATREWLRAVPFALVVIEARAIAPDPRLIEALRVQQTPVLVVTGRIGQTAWVAATASLNVRATLVRPVFIGDITRAARLALGAAAQQMG